MSMHMSIHMSIHSNLRSDECACSAVATTAGQLARPSIAEADTDVDKSQDPQVSHRGLLPCTHTYACPCACKRVHDFASMLMATAVHMSVRMHVSVCVYVRVSVAGYVETGRLLADGDAA